MTFNSKQPITLLILLGPTGVGKTDISLKVAEIIPEIEIISADSMQIYKYLDIGTAKPDKNILKRIKHHLIDIIEPDETFDAVQYSDLARKIILDIFQRNKKPMLVGGSGLYISSLIEPLFSGPGKDIILRRFLEETAKKYGNEYLYAQLSKLDPDSASRIKKNDLRRIIRALEVYKITGQPISHLQKKELNKNSKLGFEYKIIGLIRKRENLYQRINLRVDKMIEKGFIEEVDSLRKKGYKKNLNSMQGLGYKEINKYLDNEIDKETAIYLIKRNTRHYAKRQITWFKNKIKSIEWIVLDENDEKVVDRIIKIIQEIYFNF